MRSDGSQIRVQFIERYIERGGELAERAYGSVAVTVQNQRNASLGQPGAPAEFGERHAPELGFDPVAGDGLIESHGGSIARCKRAGNGVRMLPLELCS